MKLRKQEVAIAVAVAMGAMAGNAMATDNLYGSTNYSGAYISDVDNANQEYVTRKNGTVSTNYLCATAANNDYEVTYETWGTVAGGSAEYDDVTNNSVTMSGEAKASDSVGGGVAILGKATNNSVTMSGTAEAFCSVYGGLSLGDDATNNSVTMSGEAKVNAEGVYGGMSGSGNATNNSVTMSGEAKVNAEVVYGGMSSSDATGNTVTVNGAVTASEIAGGFSASGDATNNTVIVSAESGTVTVSSLYGGISGSSAANNNTVIVSSGNITSTGVYGGYSTVSANYNAVIWKGGTFTSSPSLNGGSGTGQEGNTLVIVGAGKSATDASSFQNYVFALDESTNTSTPLLTVTNALTLNSTDKVGLTIKKDASVNLKANDTVTLMKVTGGITGYNDISKSNQLDAIVSELKDDSVDNPTAAEVTLRNTYAANWIKDNTEAVTVSGLESKVNNYTFALGTTATELTATVTDVEPTVVVTDVR